MPYEYPQKISTIGRVKLRFDGFGHGSGQYPHILMDTDTDKGTIVSIPATPHIHIYIIS